LQTPDRTATSTWSPQCRRMIALRGRQNKASPWSK
jgi:hypothetical protein